MNKYFSGVYQGQKVYGVFTDPQRPTCGNLLNESFCNKLVVDSDLDDFKTHESGVDAYRWANN